MQKSSQLKPYQKERLPEEEIEQSGKLDIIVLGMGRNSRHTF